MKHNIPLNILDEYAKVISSKQANMLYENKCQKKYKKRLYEDKAYQNDSNYHLYLSSYTLDEANSSIEKALIRYVSKHKLQYNIVDDGVYLYTPLPESYMSLLEHLVKDGFNVDALKHVVDNDAAVVYLEKLTKNN